MIICTEQTDIYISTFPNALTSEKVKNHEISIYFFDKRDHSAVSRTTITLKFKMRCLPNEAHYRAVNIINIYKFSVSCA